MLEEKKQFWRFEKKQSALSTELSTAKLTTQYYLILESFDH